MHEIDFTGRVSCTLLGMAVEVTGRIALEPFGGPYRGWFHQPQGQQFTPGQDCDLDISEGGGRRYQIQIVGIRSDPEPAVDFLTIP
jgi:hypothetical protein